MKNKELISKIKELQSAQADQEWKEKTRDFLYAKISENENTATENNILIKTLTGVKNFFAQPSFAIVLVVAVVITSSLFGARAMNFMPGDSLYIAQIISEEAQLALTFNQDKKTKLGIKFASDRAKEITQVLAQAQFSGDNNKNQEAELRQDFQKEIDIVKDKLAEIQEKQENNEEPVFFSADFTKDDQGLEIASSESDKGNKKPTSDEPKQEANAHTMLAEAEELFNQEDYGGAKQKIEEVDALINQENEETDNANSEMENATSTNATSTELNQ